MQRYSSALEDFEKVLSLTPNTFDNADLMKSASISAKPNPPWILIKVKGRNKEAEEVGKDIKEGKRFRHKTLKERNAELWNTCVDRASQALRATAPKLERGLLNVRLQLPAGDVGCKFVLSSCLFVGGYYHHQPNFSLESSNYPTSSFI